MIRERIINDTCYCTHFGDNLAYPIRSPTHFLDKCLINHHFAFTSMIVPLNQFQFHQTTEVCVGTVCGYELSGIKEKAIPYLRRKLGVVFQDFQLLMDRSVEDNLKFVLSATGWKSEELMRKRISDVLSAVGMTRKAHKMPYQLSGGEQQRIAIARALLNDPEVIIADEPTGNLDNETADGIMKLLTGINREKGTAIVMVTHNRQIFEKYKGRVMVCRNETCEEQKDEEIIDLELTI